VETVHVQLSHKRRDIGMLEICTERSQPRMSISLGVPPYEQALAKSWLGVITKLSFVLDQLIRCEMLESSNMLQQYQPML